MNDSVSSEALVMPSRTGSPSAGLPPCSIDLLVDLLEGRPLDLVAPEEVGVARIGDLHLAQHLADDDLDVLVVDLHALDAVDRLHLVDEVLLEFLRAAGLEQILGSHRPLGDLVAALHDVAVGHDDVLAHRHEVFHLLAGLGIGHDHPLLAADVGAEGNLAVDLGDHAGILRAAGLEELGHPRQTAGDVLGLGHLPRRLGQQGAGADDLRLPSRTGGRPTGIE